MSVSHDILERIDGVGVLVVGDLMLDRYWWGSVTRISPEAPVPVVSLGRRTAVAGGAANVAANIAGLGARPMLVGVVGNDEDGRDFPGVLGAVGVGGEHLVELTDRPTTVKTRIVASHQHIVRIDQEDRRPLAPADEEAVLERFSAAFGDAALVVLSDYAKGLLTPRVIGEIVGRCRKAGKMVLVDPKGKDYERYRGATLLTPNRREAAEACGLDDGPHVADIAGPRLLRELGVEAVLVTQGEDGMTLFGAGAEPLHLAASAKEVFDVTGAGDTVIATLAAVLAAGGGLAEAAAVANAAAGIVIGHFGTTRIRRDELAALLAEGRGGSAASR